MLRGWLAAAALVLPAVSCGPVPAVFASSCPMSFPGPQPDPVDTLQPWSTYDALNSGDPTIAFDVPDKTEELVAVVDTNLDSKADYTTDFVTPAHEVITRDSFAYDSFTQGNPSFFNGVAELIHLNSPAAGRWEMRFHLRPHLNVDFSANVRLSALHHVHEYPLADAAASATSGHAPLVISFDASRSKVDGATQSYCWKFPDDGTVAYGETVKHGFSSRGTYEVQLTVTDSLGYQGYDEVTITLS